MPRPELLDAAVLRRWAVLARSALEAHRASIDDLNVFPVPDADTGTNMFLTLDAAVGATLDGEVTAAGPLTPVEELDRFARAALLGARGNSGVIVSQLVRGLVEELREHPDGTDAAGTARAFARAARAAYAAVTEPEEGTILTVASAAADAAGASAAAGGDLVGTVAAACAAGRSALDGTTSQLDALTTAGVVDAGGAGLVVVLEALRQVLSGEREVELPVAPHRTVEPAAPCSGAGYAGPRYEVMGVVDQGREEDAAEVRRALAGLGDSVLLVCAGSVDRAGTSGPWRLHVHVDDPAAAVEAVRRLGEPVGVVVTDLVSGDDVTAAHSPYRPVDRPGRRRGEDLVPGVVLVATAAADPLVGLLESAGVRTVRRLEPVPTADAVDAVVRGLSGSVVVLPGHPHLPAALQPHEKRWAAAGLDVVVLPAPTDAHVLAAAAVHDPHASRDEDLDALRGALDAVEARVVRCGEPVRDGLVAALGGAEDAGLVTVLLGGCCPACPDPDVVERLVHELAPDAETAVVVSGDPAYALAVGVER